MASGLGIDLGSSSIKAVRLRKRGAAWEALGAFRLEDPAPPPKPPAKPSDPLPPRAMPADLRPKLALAGVSGAGAVGITGRDLMVKYVSTPPVPPWKLRLMMELEIKGTSGAEVCGDHVALKIPGDLTREMVSLVAVAKTNYVEAQMGLAKGAGLGTEWCCPNALGLFNAFVASAQFRPGETTAVLDIGRDNMELVIQRDGALYFARSAPGGGRRFTDAIDGVFNLGYDRAEQYKCVRAAIHVGEAAGLEAGQLKVSGALREVADTLASALRGAVMFCKTQAKISKLDIERLVLSGGGAQLRGMAEYLKDKLKMPVDVLDPASRLDISRLPRDQQALLDEGSGSGGMAVAIGLAMAAADESAMRVTVLPDRVIKFRRFWRGTIWEIGAAAALAGILAFDYVAAYKQEKAAIEHKAAVDKAVAELQQKAKRVEQEARLNLEMKSRAELIIGPTQLNRPVLGFLSLLHDTTPVGVTIEKLTAGMGEESKDGARDVVVKVSGRVDPATIKPGATATTQEVYDALNAYVLTEIRKEHAGQTFKVSDARLTSQQSELERPAAGDRRIPFTFEVRLATLGVTVVAAEDSEPVPGSGPERSLIPRTSAPPSGAPADPGVRGAPTEGAKPEGEVAP